MKIEGKKVNNRQYLFIIIIILILIILSIILSTILKCIFKGDNLTGGDWLEFWGSYIGGMVTLVGVLLTLWKGNLDKREAEAKLRPHIIPLCLTFIFDYNYIKNNRKIKWLSLNDGYIEVPKIIVVNIGEKIAKDIHLNFIPNSELSKVIWNKDIDVWTKNKLTKSTTVNISEESHAHISIKELLLPVTDNNYLKEKMILREDFIKSIETMVINDIQKYKEQMGKNPYLLGMLNLKYFDVNSKEFDTYYKVNYRIKNVIDKKIQYIVEISFEYFEENITHPKKIRKSIIF